MVRRVRGRHVTESEFYISRSGSGFGDKILAGMFAVILNDNGIAAMIPNNKAYALVDCPHTPLPITRFNYYQIMLEPRPTVNWLQNNINIFRNHKGIEQEIKITRNFIPVLFEPLPDIPNVDVAINSQVGRWSSVRMWPGFDELKEMFTATGISFVDLAEVKAMNNVALNYVNNAKVYLGLETGISHYVSMVAAGKGIILQSGFTRHEYWGNYNYTYLMADMPCAPCGISTMEGQECENDHLCMKDLSVRRVYYYVLDKLVGKVGKP